MVTPVNPEPAVLDLIDVEDISYLILGNITEDNEFATMRPLQPTVIINTAKSDRVNSCGIRDWIDWITHLKGRLFLVECSTPFMTQVNNFKHFTGSATILSFYTPYFCDDCDEDFFHYMEVEELRKTSPPAIPNPPCKSCGRPLELDVHEEIYFSFLSHLNFDVPDEKIRAIIKKYSLVEKL